MVNHGSSMQGAISRLYCLCCASEILLNSDVCANLTIFSQSQSDQNMVPFSSKYPAAPYDITSGTVIIAAIAPILE